MSEFDNITKQMNGDSKKVVALIIPPSQFLLDERVFVSIGVLRIAAVLEKCGHRVCMLDLSGINNYIDVVVNFFNENEVDAVGITITTPQLPSVTNIVRQIRNIRPGLRIIAGGPHITLAYSAKNLEDKSGILNGRAAASVRTIENTFDVVCAGDGEIAILSAIQENSPKFIDGDDMKGSYFMSNEIYNQTPFPARHLVDISSYKYSIDGKKSTSLIAQLGCPFYCGFCGGRNSKSLRVIRTRTIESIVSEVEMLYKSYGYTGFMFYDDELNVNKGMVSLMNSLTNLQDRLGVEFSMRGFIKSELLTDEQAKALRRAGFKWLLCGFEAASPRILQNIKKRATINDNSRAVEIAKRNDLKIKALMSIGHPGESESSALAIRNWLVDMAVDDFDCTIITTYPGTPYYDEAIKNNDFQDIYTYVQPETGDRLHSQDVNFSEVAEYYKGDPEGGYVSHVFTDYLSQKEIVDLRDLIERDVRDVLNIPFNISRAAILYEHSMGQGIPPYILRTT